MGRPPSLTPGQQKEAIRRRAPGAMLQELARSYNASRATISKLSSLMVNVTTTRTLNPLPFDALAVDRSR